MVSRVERWIVALAVLGAVLSAYALPLHFEGNDSSICNISEGLDCDKVNRSQWSEFFGIPVALLGFLAYLAVSFAVLKRGWMSSILSFEEKDFYQYFFGFTIVMLLFQAYLTYAEAVFIKSFCILCLGSQAIVLALVLLAGYLYYKA